MTAAAPGRILASAVALLALAAILQPQLSGCGLSESELTYPGPGRAPLPAGVETLFVAAPDADRTYRPDDATGAVQRLKLLREGTTESIVYFKFSLAALADTAGVLGGDLELRVQQNGTTAVRLAAYEIVPSVADWTEETLRPPGRELLEPPFYVGEEVVDPPIGDTLLVPSAVRVPSELIRRWKNDPTSNRGFALRLAPSSADGRLDVLSKEVTILDSVGVAIATPRLVIERGDELSDASEEPGDDAYVFTDPSPSPDGSDPTLIVDGFPARRALIRFSLAELDLERGDVVHRARLHGSVVAGSIAEDESLLVEVWSVETPWEESAEPDSIDRGALHSFAVVTADSTRVTLDCASAVQRWLDARGNEGLVLRVRNEGSDATGFQLHARESGEPPYLEILATRASPPRWEGVRTR